MDAPVAQLAVGEIEELPEALDRSRDQRLERQELLRRDPARLEPGLRQAQRLLASGEVDVGLPGAGPRAAEDCLRLVEYIRAFQM